MDGANVALVLVGRSLGIAVFGVSLLQVRHMTHPNSSQARTAHVARDRDGYCTNSNVLKKVPRYLS
jgi:hypothetical protein